MSDNQYSVADFIGGGLLHRWQSARYQLPRFLQEVGLSADVHSTALYIRPRRTTNPSRTIDELAVATTNEGLWVFLTGQADSDRREGDNARTVISFPVASYLKSLTPTKATLALYIEIHSRLVSWWLANAWRARQLTDAVWTLGDTMQTIPAAACARSLLETAASFWVESSKLAKAWSQVKKDCETNGPQIEHWRSLNVQIWEMTWASKFDKKSPELLATFGQLQRTNVLTLIEKLGQATNQPVQNDYQWLCNAVHPSIGTLLAFAAPMLAHKGNTCAFQTIAPFPMSIQSQSNPDQKDVEATIESAMARSTLFAVEVLHRTLDDALRIIDDIGLTTGAPQMASFDYWRKQKQRGQNSPCPCRSGRKVKHCRHRWSDPSPSVTDRFDLGDG